MRYLQSAVAHFYSYCRDDVRTSFRFGAGLNISRIGREDLLAILFALLDVHSFDFLLILLGMFKNEDKDASKTIRIKGVVY